MTRRVLQLILGLFLYGFAIALMIRAALGISPWDVLSQGIVLRTGLSYALVTNVIGALVLLLWIPIRQRPGIGTVVNVLTIGPAIEVSLWLIPVTDNLVIRLLLLAAGLVTLAIATGLYIGARFGPGPRDGLMTGIHRRTGWPIWAVRTGIEVSVLVVGWLLGGNVGVGTLAFALLIGPMVNVTMPLFRTPEKAAPAPEAAPVAEALEATEAPEADPSRASGTASRASGTASRASGAAAAS